MIKNNKWFVIAISLFVCIAGGFYFITVSEGRERLRMEETAFLNQEGSLLISEKEEILGDESSLVESSSEEKRERDLGKLQVYICGAVEKPGVYKVEEEQRLIDLLALCGGFSEEADTASLNLARRLEDGEQIYVLTRKEAAEAAKEQEKITQEKEEAADGKININTAGLEQLMTLSGIGKAKAESIIHYRETKGSFDSIEDLMKIEGIKTAVFNKIKDMVKVK